MNGAGNINRGIIWASLGAALVCVSACSESDPSGSSSGTRKPNGLQDPTLANVGDSTATGNVGTGNSVAGSGNVSASPNTGTPNTGALAGRASPTANGGAAGTRAPAPSTGAPLAGAGVPAAVGGAADTPNVPKTPHGKNCLQPGNGNYLSPGPYKVAKKDVDLGMVNAGQHTGKYTIYYPNPLEASCLHPIVAWGNGTGVTDSDFTYDFLNTNAASWGMVVAASSEDNTGSGAFHKAGIDYLLKQNEDMSSMFFHKLSTRAGVGGHSQGGFGASVGATHPNVEAAVVEGASFVGTPKVAGLTLTGTMDLGVGAADAVQTATGPSFVGVWEGGNHIGTETVLGYLGLDTTSGDAMVSQKGSIQIQRLYAAWFRCFLADDDAACKLFSGGAPDNCGICKDPGWAKLASKNL
jgi:hypothetical protein